MSHSENPAEICNEILSIAANSERVLDADRAISKSKKGNQYKIRNRLSKNQRTCSFATILKYTGLPENVQKELVVAWPNIKEQLNPTARSLGSIVSLAYHFVVINHCLEKSALTEGFDAEKAKRSFLPRVIEAIGDVGSIATLMTQLVGNEVKGMGRMQFLLGALEQDTKHAGLKAIVKVAQAYDIELEKVPQAFVSTSHTIVAQCLKNSVSNKERSLEELTDLVQAISDLVAHDYDLSNPEKINRFCKVYDLFESPKLASQLKYLLWQCSRINKGKEFTYSSKDIDRFTRARSSYVELRSHDCSSETAARLAWDYSIVLAPGPAMQEVFDSVLTQTASFESLSARTIDWSKNGAIEDRDFANALGFIASVLGPEWKEIKKKSHEIVTYSRPFSKPSALGIQNLRKVISRLSELTADNMAKVYSRYKKEMFVSDVRDSLVTYVQSTDKTELKAAA
ncbi:MAG: hypothetical protein KDD62_14505, partial [Bdellovibrionales bacterium]|nr:hypothetical protein [Bdellovibrionales bacterium]